MWDTDETSVPQGQKPPALHTQLSLYAVSSVSGIATPFSGWYPLALLYIDSNADGEERSVMAQIYVFGRVMHELTPKESQSKQPYVCFDLMERSEVNIRTSIKYGPAATRLPGSHGSRSKGKHDLAHWIAETGGCTAKGRGHSQKVESMADGLWLSSWAIFQSKSGT